MWKLIGGVFLGWGLGSNDAANIFGTGVAARVLTYRTATILISIFVVVGALLEGYKSMDIVGEMATMSNTAAFIAALTAGLCVAAFAGGVPYGPAVIARHAAGRHAALLRGYGGHRRQGRRHALLRARCCL